MSELLGLAPSDPSTASHEGKMSSVSSMHAKLVKADYHGSILTGSHALINGAHISEADLFEKFVKVEILAWLGFLGSSYMKPRTLSKLSPERTN